MQQIRKKILIIDDIELNRAILREAFIKEYDILEAENGYEGLMSLDQNSKDIAAVFLDIIMPELDGFGVLQELEGKEFLNKVPIFLITTEATAYVATKAYDYGVVDVIAKPFNLLVIKRRVQNIIELYENRNQMEKLLHHQQQSVAMPVSKNTKKEENQWSIIETLVDSLESHSIETGEHVRRISRIVNVMLRDLSISHPECKLTDEDIEMITKASTLHDIGKIAITEKVLLKPENEGRLTEKEFEIMKTHTIKGCELIEAIRTSLDNKMYVYCSHICRSHHERWDGNGYPDKLKGNKIPLSAQVVSLADAYNALMSKSIYKEAYNHEKACSMINNGQCGSFNPILLTCFNNVIDGIYQELYANDFLVE